MKKYRIIVAFLLCLIAFSTFMTISAAAEETEAYIEAQTTVETVEMVETVETIETIETVETETSVDAPIAEAKDDGFTWTDVRNTFRDAGKFVISYKNTILSGLSTVISSIVVFVMNKSFKPTLKNIKKKVDEFIVETKDTIVSAEESVAKFGIQLETLLEDYANEKKRRQNMDAFAQICHEQASMFHRMIMQSSLSTSIKEEADRAYERAEKEIQQVKDSMKGGEANEG